MQERKLTAVVLMSGGMDSAVSAAFAVQDGYEIAALHAGYGQLTHEREYRSFKALTNFFEVRQILHLDLSYFKTIGGSALTDTNIPLGEISAGSQNIPSSYVPFRNANLLAVATSWAEVIGASRIYIGAMQLDFSGYPDCRREFFDAFEKTIQTGTKPETDIKIITPLIDFTKADVVREGTRLGVPFELTWSCYSTEDEACGVCDSCKLRLRGFEQAGLTDPIPYKKNY